MKKKFFLAIGLVALLVLPATAQVSSRQIKNSLAFYQGHLKRLIYAIGLDAVQYVEDFVAFPVDDTTGDPVGWTTTVVEAGTGDTLIAVVTTTGLSGTGAIARITSAANENDGGNYQLLGNSFELTSDQVLYVGAFGVKLNDATQTDFFIGLAATDTDILGGVTDSIGFRKVDASTTISAVVEKNSTETTATMCTAADAVAVDLELYWDGTSLEFFCNGASVATPAVTNLANDEALRVSVHFLTGEAVANTLDIDALRVIQIGR
jgi:hypothetical protein